MTFPFGSLFNPSFDGIDFHLGKFLLEFRRGHDLIRVIGSYSVPSFAVFQAISNKGSDFILLPKCIRFYIQS